MRTLNSNQLSDKPKNSKGFIWNEKRRFKTIKTY